MTDRSTKQQKSTVDSQKVKMGSMSPSFVANTPAKSAKTDDGGKVKSGSMSPTF
jgi:hypothetical protein